MNSKAMSVVFYRGLGLGFIIAGLIAAGVAWMSAPDRMEIPYWVVQHTAPVAVHIAYAPTMQLKVNDGGAYTGPAVYTFRNISGDPVKIMFPPLRVLHYTFEQTGPGLTPEFATKSFVLELAPGEEKTFEAEESFTTSAPRPDVEEGPGFRAFVFGVPPGEDPKGYCTGTVFSTHRTVWKKPDTK